MAVEDHERVLIYQNESNGDRGRGRTCDLQLRKLTLYPTELRDQINFFNKTIERIILTYDSVTACPP